MIAKNSKLKTQSGNSKLKAKKFLVFSFDLAFCLPAIALAAGALSFAFAAQAAEYTLIAPIPGVKGIKTASTFATYLQALFPFLLSIAAGLAFVMIVLGGIFYMTSAGNPAAVSAAKDRIKAALIGLLIAVSSYLIINAINPNLLSLDFSESVTPITSGTTSSSPPSNGSSPPPPASGETLTNAEAVAMLQEANIDVTSSGFCHDATQPSCTSLEGIPKSAIEKIILGQQQCESSGCGARVTGGTETGHAAHGAGLAVVDLGLQTDAERAYAQHLKDNASTLGITSICTHQNDSQYRINCSYNEPVSHLHVEF